jgi:GNAT superfamily N-acetyltransferase
MRMIRNATSEDIPRMVELGRLMHAESPNFRGMRFDADKLASAVRHAINSPAGFAGVAERDGQVIGGLVAMAVPHYFSPDEVACDLALFVAPEHRGGMAAARLVAAYRDWGKALGVAKVQMGVMAGVEAWMVEALCERLGARRVGVVMEF